MLPAQLHASVLDKRRVMPLAKSHFELSFYFINQTAVIGRNVRETPPRYWRLCFVFDRPS